MSSTQYVAPVSCETIIGFLETVERNSCSVLSFLADLIRVGGCIWVQDQADRGHYC
jgi:hypothetical protein